MTKREKEEKRIKGHPQLERIQAILRQPIPRPVPFSYAQRLALMEEAKKFYFRVRDLPLTIGNTPEVRAMIEDAHARYWNYREALWDPELIDVFAAIEQKTPWDVEPVIRFLEADPWFPQSGHAKQHLIRHLTQQKLTSTHEERLRGVVLSVIESRDRREFKSYQRLARRVDSPDLRQKFWMLSENEDRDIRRRARWMLEAVGALPVRSTFGHSSHREWFIQRGKEMANDQISSVLGSPREPGEHP